MLNENSCRQLKEQLGVRIGKCEVSRFCKKIEAGALSCSDVLSVMLSGYEKDSWNAAWILFSLDCKILHLSQDEYYRLVNYTISCDNDGIARLCVNLLYSCYKDEYCRADLLDYCIDKMVNPGVAPGLRSICMKLAFRISVYDIELVREVKRTLDCMEAEVLTPAVRCARTNVNKEIKKLLGK